MSDPSHEAVHAAAEQARAAYSKFTKRTNEAAFALGTVLLSIKQNKVIPHGMWRDFLKTAGVPPWDAARTMRYVTRHKSDSVSHLRDLPCTAFLKVTAPPQPSRRRNAAPQAEEDAGELLVLRRPSVTTHAVFSPGKGAVITAVETHEQKIFGRVHRDRGQDIVGDMIAGTRAFVRGRVGSEEAFLEKVRSLPLDEQKAVDDGLARAAKLCDRRRREAQIGEQRSRLRKLPKSGRMH